MGITSMIVFCNNIQYLIKYQYNQYYKYYYTGSDQETILIDKFNTINDVMSTFSKEKPRGD